MHPNQATRLRPTFLHTQLPKFISTSNIAPPVADQATAMQRDGIKMRKADGQQVGCELIPIATGVVLHAVALKTSLSTS